MSIPSRIESGPDGIASSHLEASLLRLAQEPMRVLPDADVSSLLLSNPRLVLDALRDGFRAWGENPDAVFQPIKQIFDDIENGGDVRLMPCFTRAPFSPVAKAVKIVGTNEAAQVVRDKITVGKAMLLHPTDHHFMLMTDACALSSFRTAAVAVLAYEIFSDRCGDGVTLVGCGRIGFYTMRLLAALKMRPRQLVCYDLNTERAETLAALARREGFVTTTASLHHALECEDALFLSTTSREAIVGDDAMRHHRFVASTGADSDSQSEITPEAAACSSVVVDSTQTALCGDLARWICRGTLSEDKLFELGKLLAGVTLLPREDAPILFVSTGIAFSDLVVLTVLQELMEGKSER